MILGAVLAGGFSSRFGSDKALAIVAGRPLIEHAIAALAAECDAVIVVGRDWPGLTSVADLPGPGLGPLGGLCAALHHAAANGYSAVITSGCDLAAIPPNLATSLSPGPAYALDQPTLGLWPAGLAPALDTHIAAGNRSLHGWTARCDARAIDLGAIANINTPADLPRN